MSKRSIFFVVASLLLLGASAALAQEAGSPPKVIRIFREENKPGRGPAHEKVEGRWAATFARANFPTHYLAMTAVSGAGEVWFVEGHDSLVSIEKSEQFIAQNAALKTEVDQLSLQDGEQVAAFRQVIATYRSDLSYRTDGVNIGQMRYFYLTTYRIRPGHDSDYIEANKLIRKAHEAANVPEHWAVFEVTLGMPRGTFLVFQPLKSLAEVDAFPQTHGRPFQDALGDDGRKKLGELISSGVLTAETNIFAFNPKMSYVSKETASADPDFWTPKPKAAAAKAAPAAKKEAGKPSGTQ